MKLTKLYKKLIIITLILSSVLGLLSGCGNSKYEYFSSSEELADKRISIWMGFTYDPFIRSIYPNADYYYYGDINLMVEALNSNKIEAFAYEDCFQSFADADGLDLTYLTDLEYETSYAFAFSENERGTRLLSEFNNFVLNSKNSGLLASLQQEWMLSGEMKPAEELNTWDTSNGTIEFTTTATAVPFIYICENRLSGYEAALLIEFCKEYHYGINVTLASWDSMIANVQTGRCDICAQSIEASEEHKLSMPMSVNTYNGNFVLFVKANPANQPKFSSFDELHGQRAASLLGSIDEAIIKENWPENEQITFQTINDCIVALINDRADFTFTDEMSAVNFSNKYDGITYLPDPIFEQPIAAAFNKTDAKSQQIKHEFNAYLRSITEDGSLNNLINKWKVNLYDADKQAREFSGEKVTIAINPTTVPYGFMKNEIPTGFEIELFESFCEKYGYIPEYLNVDFSGLIPSVVSGKADCAVAIICATEERAKQVDFSDTYLYDDLMVLVPTKGTSKTATWDNVKRSLSRTFIEENRWKMFLSGIFTTLEITICAAILGTLLGFVIYMLCRKGNKFTNTLFDVLARIFAGLPVVVILMILFYVIFNKSNLSGTFISIVGFTMCTALNVYSSLKTAVKSIDIGQTEAAYGLGFTDIQTFFKIILPQALQQFMPNYKGLIINLINGTAVVGFIAVQDLTRTSDLIRAVTYEAFMPLIATAIIYFVLGVILTNIVKHIQFNFEPERRSKEQIINQYLK